LLALARPPAVGTRLNSHVRVSDAGDTTNLDFGHAGWFVLGKQSDSNM
jgi:hypothetical protein